MSAVLKIAIQLQDTQYFALAVQMTYLYDFNIRIIRILCYNRVLFFFPTQYKDV